MEVMVSIVMPVYNAAAYLRDTIGSVRAQTYTNWELLAVDDCSEDDSYALLSELAGEDERIHPVRLEQDMGAAMARNEGTRRASGRYLAFLDADDLWEAHKLERELAFAREREAAFVFTAYEFGDAAGRGTGKIVHVPGELTYRRALSRTVIFTSTVLLDLHRLDRSLALMPDVPSEDTATWWQILRSGQTAYGLDENLVTYRRPASSLSSNKGRAICRIWGLYRRQEKLSLVKSVWYFCFWAIRATARRI